MAKPKTTDLFLVLKKAAFEITGTPEKPFELRENTEWIKSRLLKSTGVFKEYDTVTFQLGYQKGAPRKTFKYNGFNYLVTGQIFEFSNRLQFIAKPGTIKILLGERIDNG